MIRKFKNKGGETILETIIAVSILAIGVTLSSTLMANSLRNINTSKNRVIAVNIAREGIEAVRNIRDTNWLKFSGNIRDCWNHMPQDITDPVECTETCSGSYPIAPGDYIVYKAEGIGSGISGCETIQRWRLTSLQDIGTSPDTISNSVLYQVDIDPTDTDTDGDGVYDNDKDIYNHLINTNPDIGSNDAMGRYDAEKTNFSRVITIEYLNNDGTVIDSDDWAASADKDKLNRLRVTSAVTWIRGEVEHSVILKTHLTDYFGRDDLDS